MKRKSIVLFTVLYAASQAASAQVLDKPYDAMYEHITPAGTNFLRMSSDGQGHLRTESTLAGRSIVTINDMKNRVGYTIDDTGKKVVRIPLSDTPGAPPADESLKTSLGTRVLEGRNCEGWEYKRNGHTAQTWIDSDVGCCVVSMLDGKVQMRLKTSSKTPLAPVYFSVPPNYPVVDMNQQIHQAQEYAKQYQNRQKHR